MIVQRRRCPHSGTQQRPATGGTIAYNERCRITHCWAPYDAWQSLTGFTAVADRAQALLPTLDDPLSGQRAISAPINTQDAAGATTDAPHLHVAISAAEEAQLHAASAALQSDDSRGTDDNSRTQAAPQVPQAANPTPPTRTAATVRAGLIAAGMRDDSAQDKTLLDAVVASVMQDSRVPGTTAPPSVSVQEPRPAVELPGAEPVRRTAQAGNAQQHGLIDTRGNNHTSPRSLRSTFGLTLPATLRPTGSALHGAATPTYAGFRCSGPHRSPSSSHTTIIRPCLLFSAVCAGSAQQKCAGFCPLWCVRQTAAWLRRMPGATAAAGPSAAARDSRFRA